WGLRALTCPEYMGPADSPPWSSSSVPAEDLPHPLAAASTVGQATERGSRLSPGSQQWFPRPERRSLANGLLNGSAARGGRLGPCPPEARGADRPWLRVCP